MTSIPIILVFYDENEFQFLRRQLLDHRRAARTAKTMDYNNFPPNVDPLMERKIIETTRKGQLHVPSLYT